MAEIIGSAAIDIKARDKDFERQVRKIAGKIKDVEIPVKADIDTSQATKQLESFRKSQQARRLKLYVDIDTRKATTTLNKFIKKFSENDINLTLNVDTDSLMEAGHLLDDFEEQYHNKNIDLNVEVNENVEESLNGVERALERLRTNSSNSSNFNIDTSKAETNINRTSSMFNSLRRGVSSPLRMNIDKESMAGLKGLFYTLTGGIPIQAVKSTLTGLAANFESISVKSGTVATGVTALAGSLSHAVGDLLVIGSDATQVIGLLNAAPAALAAGGLALSGTMLGWKGFGKALMGEGEEAAEALKLLPPEAQKAVKSLDGMGSSIRQVTQKAYWRSMGTAVEDVAKTINKDLHDGMKGAGSALGGQMEAIFGSIQEFGESGGLRNTFDDLTEFFETSTPALAGFTSGFLDLMEGGAREMPAFGTWLSKLGTDFGAWAKEANESGAINIWIAEGVQRMKELGKVTQATYGIFSGLTSAARNAGMNGLTDFAEGMVNVSNAMNSPAFQKGLTSFFTSTRVGAANALPGVERFFSTIGEGLPTINTAIEKSGVITGNMFGNFSRMFENGNMGKGFLALLDGMQDGTAKLEPGFESLGNALGGLMEISGEVVRNVAPGLNQLFETLDVVVNNIKGGFIDAMPVFNEFIQGLLAGIRSVVGPLASFAGATLSAFANLPGPIQTALMSVGAFMAAQSFLTKRMKDSNSAVGQFATNTRDRMRNLSSSVVSSAQVVSQAYGKFDPSKSSAFIGPQTLAQTNSNAQKLINANRTAASRIADIWVQNDLKQESIRNKRNRINNEVRQATTIQSGIGGQILPSTGRGSFEVIQNNAKTAAASAKSSLSSIGKTAGVVGGQITKGIGTAMGGLMGAMGGPWGLAVTGVIAGMAAIGQASADGKQRVEDLKKTLTEDGGVTSTSKDMLADNLYNKEGNFLDKITAFKEFHAGGDKVSQTLDKIGLSANTVVDNLMLGGEETKKVWEQIDYYATHGDLDGSQMSKFFSDEDLNRIGMGRDQLEALNNTEIKFFAGSGINQLTSDLDKASANVKNLQKDFEGLAKSQVLDNKTALESVSSTLEEKMSAFKSNLKLGNLEQLSGQQGFYQLGVVTDQNNQKLQALQTTLKASGQSIKDTFDMKDVAGTNVAMFDMTTQAGRQMFEVVGSQADAIHSSMMSSYDTVLKQTGSLEQAQTAALDTAKKDISAFTTELRNAGLETEQIKQVLDTAGLSESDITLALKTEGIDEAISQAMAVEAAMQGIRTGDWTISIDVMAEQARSEIAETLGLAKDASSQDIVQNIRAKFDNAGEYQTWMAEFNKSIPEQRARMVAELVNGDQAKSAIDAITAKGGELDGQTWKSAIQVVDEGSKATVDQIYTAINSIPPETLAKITAEVQGDPGAELDAVLGSKQFKAKLKAVLEGDIDGEVESKIPKGKTVEVETKVTGDPAGDIKSKTGNHVEIDVQPKVEPISKTALFGGGQGSLSQTIELTPKVTDTANISIPAQTVDVNPQLTGAESINIPDQTANVNLVINDGGLAGLQSTLSSVSDKSITVNVAVIEAGLSSLRDTMNSLTNKNVSVNVTTNESNLNSIKDTMNSLTNKNISVNVSANSGGLQQIQSAMNSLTNKSVSISIKANTGPINAIKSAMGAIVNKSVTVVVNASTGPVNALKAAINSIVNKTVTITANAPTGAVNALRAAIAGVVGKTVSVTANTNTGAVYGLIGAINAVRGKTVTVTVRTNRVGAEADGGIYTNNVKTYARGGYNDPRIAKAIERAQRRTGRENHTAQIARGSNNYRVWAEPETGGEAYIPLAMSKRLRSLKILEQVASHFGLSLERYADGGLISGNKVSSNVTTFASGGTTKSTKKTAAQKKAEEAEKKRKADLKELNKTIKESIADLKKALSDGLSDLKSAFGKADESPVQKALSGMRTGIRDFKNETTKQIKEAKKLGKSTKTMAAQVKAANALDKKIANQRVSSSVWNRKGSNLEDSRYIARNAISRQKDRRVDYNSKFTLRDYERALDYVKKELDVQQDKYDTMVKNHRSNMDSISSGLFKQFDLGSLVSKKDEYGYRPPTTAREISTYAKKMLDDMNKFSKNLGALRKAGYNEAIINQISQMGLEEGLVVSQALLSDKSQMKSINSSYTKMFGKRGDMFVDPKTGELGFDPNSLVGKIGKSGADAMFKAGIDTQRGLVKGLTAEVSAIEKAGQTMADALVKSFKKALKIKSPSRVFMGLGKFIPQGLTAGIDSGQGMVDSSISNLVQPKKFNFGANSSNTTSKSGIINGNSGTNPVTVNVYPSEGMSERQVGTTAAREIYFRMDSAL